MNLGEGYMEFALLCERFTVFQNKNMGKHVEKKFKYSKNDITKHKAAIDVKKINSEIQGTM